jgi:hypothetical protein
VTEIIKNVIKDNLYSLLLNPPIFMLLTDLKNDTLRDLPFFLCDEQPRQSIDLIDIVGTLTDMHWQEKSNSVSHRDF